MSNHTESQQAQPVNPSYTPIAYSPTGYSSFKDFYPYYLGEHSNPICRRLHLLGTSISVLALIRIVLSFLPAEKYKLPISKRRLVVGSILQAYFWAWIGHFFFEKNKPATFKHPIMSLRGDLRLWLEFVSAQRRV